MMVEFKTRALARTVLLSVTLMWGATGCSSCTEGTLGTRESEEGELRDEMDPNRPAEANDYVLVAAGARQHSVDVGRDLTLGVYLYSKTSGEAVQDEMIQYEVIEGAALANLASAQGSTDTEGLSQMTLRAQDRPGEVTIKVSHPLSNEVTFTVSLLAAATSDIRVEMINTNPSILTLNNIDVRLYPSAGYSCNEFLPLRQQTEPLELVRAATVNQQVDFAGLNPSKRFIVTAVARGEEYGQIAASGCVEDIVLSPNEVSKVELALILIPLNPVGRYEVNAYWDYSEAVAESGPVGATITRILALFEDPGEAIYNEIIAFVRNTVGGLISGAFNTFLSLTNLDDAFKNMINNAVEGNQALRRVRDAGRDVGEVISNLHVTSIMTVGKVNSSYEFSAADNWLGVTVYWRWDCAENAPPECGAIPLLVEGGTDVADLGILSTQWNGRVVAYDQLQVDQHPLTLRYGRLLIYILNDVIIDRLTDGNANSLSEAFAYWVGCGSLATTITGADGEICALSACLEDSQIEGFCATAVGTVFGFADALIRSLEFDVGMRVGGDATLIEQDSDGFVDQIVEGRYEGFMTGSDGSGQGVSAAPINATWEAVRVGFETDNL